RRRSAARSAPAGWRDIDEVLFAEAASSLGTRSPWLRQCHGDAGLLAGLDLFALIVAAISYSIERLDGHFGSCLLGHIRELMAIRADVRHLVGHNWCRRRFVCCSRGTWTMSTLVII